MYLSPGAIAYVSIGLATSISALSARGRSFIAPIAAVAAADALTVYFTGLYSVIPSSVLSLLSAYYIYTPGFYLPFSALFVLSIAASALRIDGYWPGADIGISAGTIIAMLMDGRIRGYVRRNESMKGRDRGREINRDIMQSVVGSIIIGAVFAFGLTLARELVSVAALILYIVGSYFTTHTESWAASFLLSLERGGTPLGIGAIWFASGVLLALAIVPHVRLLAVTLFVLVIGDSLATIVGTSVKSARLIFNRKKSVAGFLAIFLSSALFGLFMAGWHGVVLALAGSLVESAARYPFDDNYLIPLTCALISNAL